VHGGKTHSPGTKLTWRGFRSGRKTCAISAAAGGRLDDQNKKIGQKSLAFRATPGRQSALSWNPIPQLLISMKSMF
jgi:hypothetical protein